MFTSELITAPFTSGLITGMLIGWLAGTFLLGGTVWLITRVIESAEARRVPPATFTVPDYVSDEWDEQ
jgi:hypothetical protein